MWRIQAANYHFATRNSEFQGNLATGFKTKTDDTAPAMWSNNETNSCEATIFISRQYNQKSTICDVVFRNCPVRFLYAWNRWVCSTRSKALVKSKLANQISEFHSMPLPQTVSKTASAWSIPVPRRTPIWSIDCSVSSKGCKRSWSILAKILYVILTIAIGLQFLVCWCLLLKALPAPLACIRQWRAAQWALRTHGKKWQAQRNRGPNINRNLIPLSRHFYTEPVATMMAIPPCMVMNKNSYPHARIQEWALFQAESPWQALSNYFGNSWNPSRPTSELCKPRARTSHQSMANSEMWWKQDCSVWSRAWTCQKHGWTNWRR